MMIWATGRAPSCWGRAALVLTEWEIPRERSRTRQWHSTCPRAPSVLRDLDHCLSSLSHPGVDASWVRNVMLMRSARLMMVEAALVYWEAESMAEVLLQVVDVRLVVLEAR